MSGIYCTKCGALNADHAWSCGQCGNALPASRQPLSAQASPPYQQSSRFFIPNNLVWAILATLFCCLPLGIPAIVYASQVDGKAAAGDVAGAESASKAALTWCWIAAIAGLSIIVFVVVRGAVGGGGAGGT